MRMFVGRADSTNHLPKVAFRRSPASEVAATQPGTAVFHDATRTFKLRLIDIHISRGSNYHSLGDRHLIAIFFIIRTHKNVAIIHRAYRA